ncbi:MAG: glycosyltransferase family 1 protein, partial [Pedobacter sp.]
LTFGNKLNEQPSKIDYAADRLSYRFDLPYWLTKVISSFLLQSYYPLLPAVFNIKYYTNLHLASFQSLVRITDEWWVYSKGIRVILLKQIESNKIIFQRHGISPVFFKVERNAEGPHKFLFSGRLVKIKGFQTLLTAWSQLEENTLKELWITGDSNLGDYITKKFLKKIGHRKDIKFLGSLTQEELSNTYAQTHTLIIPSECYEIGPLVFHEAIACGCNVIASDVGGCKELAEYYQGSTTSFEAGDVQDLKDKINQQLSLTNHATQNKPIAFNTHFEMITQQSDVYIHD